MFLAIYSVEMVIKVIFFNISAILTIVSITVHFFFMAGHKLIFLFYFPPSTMNLEFYHYPPLPPQNGDRFMTRKANFWNWAAKEALVFYFFSTRDGIVEKTNYLTLFKIYFKIWGQLSVLKRHFM